MSSRLELLIITPAQNSQGRCGLAHHACCLADELQRRGWHVVIAGPESLLINPARPLLLQFTPYAYSRLGLPLVLLFRLMLLRLQRFLSAKQRRMPIVVFFHEVPFLNRSGWKGRLVIPVQRLFCIMLARISTNSLVNQASPIPWLGLLRPLSAPQFLPCWSNVGEDPDPTEPQQRPLQVVVFGSPGKRRHAHQLVARLGGYRLLFGSAVRVFDIGEPRTLPAALLDEVTSLGSLEDDEVREILRHSRFGWFYAEPDQVSKSGVFAAYCALGVLPILAFRGADPGSTFLVPSELPLQNIAPERLQNLRSCGRAWFHQHSLAQGTERILQLLNPC